MHDLFYFFIFDDKDKYSNIFHGFYLYIDY